jgi:hypothetical protein
MKRLTLVLLAVAELVATTAAAASACHGHRWSGTRGDGSHFQTVAYASKHHFFRNGSGGFEKLHGHASDFRDDSASAHGKAIGNKLREGTYTASISTDWSKATANRFGGQCAPASGTVTFTGSDSSNTFTEAVDGITCTVGSNPWNVASVFFGKGTVTSATGKAAGLVGKEGRILLLQKTDGTLKGFTFAGFHGEHKHHLAAFSERDAHHCDGDGRHHDSRQRR